MAKDSELTIFFENILFEVTAKTLNTHYGNWAKEFPFHKKDPSKQPTENKKLFDSLYGRKSDYNNEEIAELIWMITTFGNDGELDSLKKAVNIIKQNYITNELNNISCSITPECSKIKLKNEYGKEIQISPCLLSLHSYGNLNDCKQKNKSLNCPVAWIANALIYIENNYLRLKMPKNRIIEDVNDEEDEMLKTTFKEIKEFDEHSDQLNSDLSLLPELWQKCALYDRQYIISIEMAYIKWYFAQILFCPTSKKKIVQALSKNPEKYDEEQIYRYLLEASCILQSLSKDEALCDENLVKNILVSKLTTYTVITNKYPLYYREPLIYIINIAENYERLFKDKLNKLAVCIEAIHTLIWANQTEYNSFLFFDSEIADLENVLNNDLNHGKMKGERKKIFYLLKLRSLLYRFMHLNYYANKDKIDEADEAIGIIENFCKMLSNSFTKTRLKDNINTYIMYKVMNNEIRNCISRFYVQIYIKDKKQIRKIETLYAQYQRYCDEYNYNNMPSCKISEYMRVFGDHIIKL
ncbi:MAG: hypothetical protein ACI4XP_01355 [Acutalibacteraceae bacterium]